MGIISKIDNFLSENKFKIVYCYNKIDINNYLEVLDFDSSCIKIKYDGGICFVNGNNLCIIRMLDNELLIEGNIISVILS